MGILNEPAQGSSAGTHLSALDGMRFLAVFHIFLYHLESSAYASVDTFPHWLYNLFEHGYISTSFFFLLSGFILSYLYWKPNGEMAVSRERFWWQRFTRVYPIHIVVLLLTVPVDMFLWHASLDVPPVPISVASAVATATLTQAWYAPLVPLWSWPTWALSALVFLYFIMPWLMRLLARLSRAQAMICLLAMPVISLLPTLLFLDLFPNGAPHHRNWHIQLGSTPLFWVTHFVAGMLMSRVFSISRFEQAWRTKSRPWISAGDFALVGILLLCLSEPQSLPWHLILRHGAVMPLHLIVLYDLALGRGIAARVLSIRPLRFLGATSFSIFIWQNLLMAIGLMIVPALALPKWLAFTVAAVGVLLVAIASTYWIERPLARRLRRWVPGRQAVQAPVTV